MGEWQEGEVKPPLTFDLEDLDGHIGRFVEHLGVGMKSSCKPLCQCLLPHHTECTSSHLTTEVKQCRAGPVPGWVTTWEQPVL